MLGHEEDVVAVLIDSFFLPAVLSLVQMSDIV